MPSQGRDLDITRYFIHVEKANKTKENMGKPAMKVVFLYLDFGNEGQEPFTVKVCVCVYIYIYIYI